MNNKNPDIHKLIRQYKIDHGLLQPIRCSHEEEDEYKRLLKSNKRLPDDVLHKNDYNENTFYRIPPTDLTCNEVAEYIAFRQLRTLEYIKNCLLFFVILAAVGLIGYWLVFVIEFI